MENSSLFIILQRMRKPFLVILISYTIAIIGLLIIDGVDNNGNPYKMTIFDSFYFISYTASTIGFGETPYEFTYPQRLWVSFSIYLTVIAWFYGIGTLVSLLQDKVFLREMERAKFRRKIKSFKQKFIIVLGYDQTSSKIIKKVMRHGIRTVVIEKNETNANELILENFTPSVPVLISDSYNPKVLEEAGIKKFNCKALVSIFEDDSLNLRTSLTSKLLNPHIKLAVKSTTSNQTENLKDLDVEIVANPFSIISNEVSMALNAPNLFKLEKWIYQIDDLNASLPSFPNGKYIICGYGRMGKEIHKVLEQKHIEAVFVEIDEKKVNNFNVNKYMKIAYGNADDKELLQSVGIKNAVAIICSTNDDTTNLSILATAKKLNPNIMTIARENEMDDLSIFESAKIDHILMPSKILINKITNALIHPLADEFIKQMSKKDDIWGLKLVKKLLQEIDENPLLYNLKINEKKAPQIYSHIDKGENVKLNVLCKSLYNRDQNNNVVPLLLKKDSGETILLPNFDISIEKKDEILFACDENAKNDMEYIALNPYEFHYAHKGEEKETILKGIFK
ncbi:MAG: potassium transporter TrkA [Arcobacter sp.]|nr:MAG: potassium transporter TrkA [Arcobacter sp.]